MQNQFAEKGAQRMAGLIESPTRNKRLARGHEIPFLDVVDDLAGDLMKLDMQFASFRVAFGRQLPAGSITKPHAQFASIGMADVGQIQSYFAAQEIPVFGLPGAMHPNRIFDIAFDCHSISRECGSIHKRDNGYIPGFFSRHGVWAHKHGRLFRLNALE
jgi:hypothetical protein